MNLFESFNKAYDKGFEEYDDSVYITECDDYDFDDEYEERRIDTDYHDASEDELRKMGAFDNFNDTNDLYESNKKRVKGCHNKLKEAVNEDGSVDIGYPQEISKLLTRGVIDLSVIKGAIKDAISMFISEDAANRAEIELDDKGAIIRGLTEDEAYDFYDVGDYEIYSDILDEYDNDLYESKRPIKKSTKGAAPSVASTSTTPRKNKKQARKEKADAALGRLTGTTPSKTGDSSNKAVNESCSKFSKSRKFKK